MAHDGARDQQELLREEDIRIQQDGERIDEDEKAMKLLLKEELQRSQKSQRFEEMVEMNGGKRRKDSD
jgi:hypothetical protein